MYESKYQPWCHTTFIDRNSHFGLTIIHFSLHLVLLPVVPSTSYELDDVETAYNRSKDDSKYRFRLLRREGKDEIIAKNR